MHVPVGGIMPVRTAVRSLAQFKDMCHDSTCLYSGQGLQLYGHLLPSMCLVNGSTRYAHEQSVSSLVPSGELGVCFLESSERCLYVVLVLRKGSVRRMDRRARGKETTARRSLPYLPYCCSRAPRQLLAERGPASAVAVRIPRCRFWCYTLLGSLAKCLLLPLVYFLLFRLSSSSGVTMLYGIPYKINRCACTCRMSSSARTAMAVRSALRGDAMQCKEGYPLLNRRTKIGCRIGRTGG